MVTPISEQEAREVLAAARSAAADSRKYLARRLDGGWLFGWNPDVGRPPMNTRSWVVSDRREARWLKPKEYAEEALRALNGA